MSHILRIFVFVVALVMMPVPTNATTLWQDTIVGMSPADVINLHPDCLSKTPDVNEFIIKSERVEIFKGKFLVIFKFAKSKLVSVKLLSTDSLAIV